MDILYIGKSFALHRFTAAFLTTKRQADSLSIGSTPPIRMGWVSLGLAFDASK